MKAILALFALCALFPGVTQLALAQDDGAPKAPAPAAPGDRGTASHPQALGKPKTPAAGAHQKEEAGEIAPPTDDEVPEASDPYAHDPYEPDASKEEAGSGDGEPPEMDAPPAGAAHEPGDPYPVDETDTGPDDATGD